MVNKVVKLLEEKFWDSWLNLGRRRVQHMMKVVSIEKRGNKIIKGKWPKSK